MYDTIKNFNKGQDIQFDDSIVQVLDLAGKVDTFKHGKIVHVQVYKVLYHNEIYYATDYGLFTGDPEIFKKVIAGVGYRGFVNYKQYPKEYEMWKSMIYRCHYRQNNLYPFYGGAGVRMDEKWESFELFLYDIVNLPNYEKLRYKNKTKYELDMAIKQRGTPYNERIYGPGLVEIKDFSSSDVCSAYRNYKNGNIPTVSTHIDSADQCTVKTPPKPKEPTGSSDFQQYTDGQWPPAAYDAVVNNPPKLPIPDIDDLGYNKTRVFNGVKYSDRPPLKPTKSTDIIKPKGLYKGIEMCKIVDNSKPRNK